MLANDSRLPLHTPVLRQLSRRSPARRAPHPSVATRQDSPERDPYLYSSPFRRMSQAHPAPGPTDPAVHAKPAPAGSSSSSHRSPVRSAPHLSVAPRRDRSDATNSFLSSSPLRRVAMAHPAPTPFGSAAHAKPVHAVAKSFTAVPSRLLACFGSRVPLDAPHPSSSSSSADVVATSSRPHCPSISLGTELHSPNVGAVSSNTDSRKRSLSLLAAAADLVATKRTKANSPGVTALGEHTRPSGSQQITLSNSSPSGPVDNIPPDTPPAQ